MSTKYAWLCVASLTVSFGACATSEEVDEDVLGRSFSVSTSAAEVGGEGGEGPQSSGGMPTNPPPPNGGAPPAVTGQAGSPVLPSGGAAVGGAAVGGAGGAAAGGISAGGVSAGGANAGGASAGAAAQGGQGGQGGAATPRLVCDATNAKTPECIYQIPIPPGAVEPATMSWKNGTCDAAWAPVKCPELDCIRTEVCGSEQASHEPNCRPNCLNMIKCVAEEQEPVNPPAAGGASAGGSSAGGAAGAPVVDQNAPLPCIITEDDPLCIKSYHPKSKCLRTIGEGSNGNYEGSFATKAATALIECACGG